MLAIEAILDGKQITPVDPNVKLTSGKVIVILLDEKNQLIEASHPSSLKNNILECSTEMDISGKEYSIEELQEMTASSTSTWSEDIENERNLRR